MVCKDDSGATLDEKSKNEKCGVILGDITWRLAAIYCNYILLRQFSKLTFHFLQTTEQFHNISFERKLGFLATCTKTVIIMHCSVGL